MENVGETEEGREKEKEGGGGTEKERLNENPLKTFSSRVYSCMFKCIETSSDLLFGTENL